ncbi:hypothetical protein CyaNS01_02053 [Cyanobium sp. NS01]|nr:hypothetical protein CyaNS01_02053 [Cyanobium sp. NS01]
MQGQEIGISGGEQHRRGQGQGCSCADSPGSALARIRSLAAPGLGTPAR